MGMGVRAFVFEDHGTIRKVSSKVISDMLMGKSHVAFPEYAGKRIRFAVIFVDMVDRKPKRITRTEFLQVGFDSKGRADGQESTEKMRLAGTVLSGSFSDSSDSNDILESLQPDLAGLKYKDKYRWNPSPSEIRSLKELVFNR